MRSYGAVREEPGNWKTQKGRAKKLLEMTGRQEDVTKVAAHCENVPDGVDVHLEVMMEHLVEKEKKTKD